MKREDVAALLPIIKAFGEGKTIQYREETGFKWTDLANSSVAFNCSPEHYRINPEVAYRPFNGHNEFDKHAGKAIVCIGDLNEPFDLSTYTRHLPRYWSVCGVKFFETGLIPWDKLLDEWLFSDGSPCGIREEP